MHPSKKVQKAILKADETPTKVLSHYANFADLFSPKLVVELPEHIEINDYALKLVENW